MGVFERQGNSSSFKGAGATVAAAGVGLTLQTDKDTYKKINFHLFQSSLIPGYAITCLWLQRLPILETHLVRDQGSSLFSL